MISKELFDLIPLEKQAELFDFFKQYPELAFSTIERLERKIKAVKENNRKELDKIFHEEKVVVQKVVDQLSLLKAQEKIDQVNS